MRDMGFGILGFSLLVVSGLLLDAHTRRWRRESQTSDVTPDCQTRYRRRMTASGLIGFAGLLMGIMPLVPRTPLAVLLHLWLLTFACLGMIVLAWLDARAGLVQMTTIRQAQTRSRARLLAELQQAQSRTEGRPLPSALESDSATDAPPSRS